MAWTLNGTTIPAPTKKNIVYDTQKVTNRVLSGAFSRSYIGSEKIIVSCEWDFLSASDWAFIKAAYDDQRANGSNVKTLAIAELSLSLSVIIDIQAYELPMPNHYNYAAVRIDFIQN